MPPRQTPPVLDSELIARRMAANKLSKRALARRLGWSHTRVSGVLNGTNHAQLDVYELVALAGALDLELHELILRTATQDRWRPAPMRSRCTRCSRVSRG